MLSSTLRYFVLPWSSCTASPLSAPTTRLGDLLLGSIEAASLAYSACPRQAGWARLGPAIPVLPRCRFLPRPLDAEAEIIRALSHQRGKPSTPAPAPSLRSRHHPPTCHPSQHHPRTSRGAVFRAGGREENKSLRVLVFDSLGYGMYAPSLRLRAPGSGGRRCRCDCGCGRESRRDTGMHGTGAGGGPCSVGSMLAWPRCTFWGAMCGRRVGTASTMMRRGEGTSRGDVARETNEPGLSVTPASSLRSSYLHVHRLKKRTPVREEGMQKKVVKRGRTESKTQHGDRTSSCTVCLYVYLRASISYSTPTRMLQGSAPACSNAFSQRDPASLPALPSPFLRCAARPPPSRRLPAATVIPFTYCLARRPGLNVRDPNARAPHVPPAPIDLALGVLRRVRRVSLLTRNASAARERHPR
ncbi:hypothetical protein B0H14DRAFT_1036233 [Mycena olivaceomarginata]|nr:hypothetical protein B0H14DRAFT_1036233 [Mycena olivaceomarginata]